MDEAQPFLRTILDDPANPFPRLIFADWLAERGDPREWAMRGNGQLDLRPEREGQFHNKDADDLPLTEPPTGHAGMWVVNLLAPIDRMTCVNLHCGNHGCGVVGTTIPPGNFEARHRLTISLFTDWFVRVFMTLVGFEMVLEIERAVWHVKLSQQEVCALWLKQLFPVPLRLPGGRVGTAAKKSS